MSVDGIPNETVPTLNEAIELCVYEESPTHRRNDDDNDAEDDGCSQGSYSLYPHHAFCFENAFFVGALFGTLAAIVDLIQAIRGDDDDDPSSSEHQDPILNPWKFWTGYKVLIVISTFMYLIESILEGCDSEHRWMFPLLFGSAASMDLLSCLLDDDFRPWPSAITGWIAAHLFLLSALVTLYENRSLYVHAQEHSVARAILAGDLLFLTGSVIDTVISYVDTPKTSMEWIPLACWGLGSAVTWLVDSIIYRWAHARSLNISSDIDGMSSAPYIQIETEGEEDTIQLVAD